MESIIRAADTDVVATPKAVLRERETALPRRDDGPLAPFMATYARIGLARFDQPLSTWEEV